MFYEVYDKNGNRIGMVGSREEASRLAEQANLRIMEQEGASPMQRAMYSAEMERRRTKARQNDADNFKAFLMMAAIAAGIILLGVLLAG